MLACYIHTSFIISSRSISMKGRLRNDCCILHVFRMILEMIGWWNMYIQICGENRVYTLHQILDTCWLYYDERLIFGSLVEYTLEIERDDTWTFSSKYKSHQQTRHLPFLSCPYPFSFNTIWMDVCLLPQFFIIIFTFFPFIVFIPLSTNM